MHRVVTALCTYAVPFDALTEEDLSSYRVHVWCGKTRMAGLQAGGGRTMIDSVVLAQYIHQRDRHANRHTDTSS